MWIFQKFQIAYLEETMAKDVIDEQSGVPIGMLTNNLSYLIKFAEKKCVNLCMGLPKNYALFMLLLIEEP